MVRRVLLVTLAILASVLTIFATATAQQGAAAPSLAGTWTGFYPAGSNFVRITIRLSLAGQGFSGDLRFDPLNRNKTNGVPMGQVGASAQFDVYSRTLTLTPANDAYGVLGTQVPTFSGVLNASGTLAAGILTTRAYPGQRGHWMMARSGSAEAKALDSTIANLDRRSEPQQRVGGILGALGNSGSGLFSEKKLREWGSQFVQAYPKVDAYRTSADVVMESAAILFRDEYFRPFFGKSFDELSVDETKQFERGLEAIPAPRGAYPEEMINGLLLTLKGRVGAGSGSLSGSLGLSVVAMRQFEAWRRDMIYNAQNYPPSEEGWRLLSDAQTAERQFFAKGLPAERASFDDSINQGRTRMADALIQFETDRFLRDQMAQDTQLVAGVLDALAQAGAPLRQGVGNQPPIPQAAFPSPPGQGNPVTPIRFVAPYASQAVKDSQAVRLRAQLASAVGAQCDADKRAIGVFASGLAGLQESAQFYRQASSRYAQSGSSCDFQSALANARRGMFVSAESTISTRIRAAGTPSELSAITSAYFGVPTDNSDPTGQRLLRQLSDRQAAMQRASAAQAAADAEIRRQGICASASNDAVGGEPSEKDMCIAVNNRINLELSRGDSLAGNCNSINGNPMAAMTCLMGMSMQAGTQGVGLGKFEKIACASAAPIGKPGFNCDYTVKIDMNNDVLGPLAAASRLRVVSARFVKTSNGWVYFETNN